MTARKSDNARRRKTTPAASPLTQAVRVFNAADFATVPFGGSRAVRADESACDAAALRTHLAAFRDDLMREGHCEAARGMTRLLRDFDFLTRGMDRARRASGVRV